MSNIPHSLGGLFSRPDVRDYVAKSTLTTEFPETFYLTNMPKVKDQGQVGSCVAHSCALVTEYFNEKETGKFTRMSTAYIYGNRLLSLHKGYGMYTRDALKTLSIYGNVPYESLPGNVEVPEALDLYEKNAEKLETEGIPYVIQSYYKLKDVNAMKAHLLTGNPIVFAMYWFDDIKIISGVMNTAEVKTKKTGAHCMVIYGWNSTGWLVQNSWSSNWAKKGRCIIPYSVSLYECWGVTDAPAPEGLDIKKPFKTKFGKCLAKLFNKVITWFYNLFHRGNT